MYTLEVFAEIFVCLCMPCYIPSTNYYAVYVKTSLHRFLPLCNSPPPPLTNYTYHHLLLHLHQECCNASAYNTVIISCLWITLDITWYIQLPWSSFSAPPPPQLEDMMVDPFELSKLYVKVIFLLFSNWMVFKRIFMGCQFHGFTWNVHGGLGGGGGGDYQLPPLPPTTSQHNLTHPAACQWHL